MQLFYHPSVTNSEAEVFFNKEESRHIGKVMRMQQGDILWVTNGKGQIFETQLEMVTPKKCVAVIVSIENQPPLPYHLHLAVAPTKLNDRYEWFLEKAVEIGVSKITPIISAHSERKVIKQERFEKILQSAMKQSLKAYLPKLNKAIGFKEFIAQNKTGHLLIAHCADSKKTSLKSQVGRESNYQILIGPEGDFSPNEIELALEHGYKPVSLGDTRLRTETAAIVACHSVAFAHHD